jgi:hypothetical protein
MAICITHDAWDELSSCCMNGMLIEHWPEAADDIRGFVLENGICDTKKGIADMTQQTRLKKVDENMDELLELH